MTQHGDQNTHKRSEWSLVAKRVENLPRCLRLLQISQAGCAGHNFPDWRELRRNGCVDHFGRKCPPIAKSAANQWPRNGIAAADQSVCCHRFSRTPTKRQTAHTGLSGRLVASDVFFDDQTGQNETSLKPQFRGDITGWARPNTIGR